MIFVMFDQLVVKRLKVLAGEMDQYPKPHSTNNFALAETDDEIGMLAKHFRKLCQRHDRFQQELDASREQVFQSEKLAALGRLVAGVSHEINNPLGGMQNCIQTLRKHPDNPETVSRYLELLNQGVASIKNTVQQLLKIGRKEPLVLQLGNVDQMIRECLELTCMGRDDILLDTRLSVQQPVLVSMEILRQVIVNLAGNAVQAMGRSGGTLTVTSGVDVGSLLIEVADTGPGIAPEHQDKIFEPFFTTKEVGEGTGLGLSVSYSLVEGMGGELTAGNRSEGGAIFTVAIPLGHESLLSGEKA
jgi:signal transduction histidine kinase